MLLLCTLFATSINAVSWSVSCFLSSVPDKSLRHIDAHYICVLLGIADVIFGIIAFLQMARRQQLEDTGAHYEVPKTLGPGGTIRLMERRPNSGPDIPCLHYPIIVSIPAICPCLFGAGTTPYIPDDMLGRAAIPRVQHRQFATSVLCKEKLAPAQA